MAVQGSATPQYTPESMLPAGGGDAVYPGTSQESLSQNSQATGYLGVGLQAVGQGFRTFSAIEGAERTAESARRVGAAEREAIREKYTQAFQNMAEKQRREGATRMVAASASGVQMEGSIMEVFAEAKEVADRQRARTIRGLGSEIERSRAKQRQSVKAAKDKKDQAIMSGALRIGATAAGYAAGGPAGAAAAGSLV